MVIPLFNSSECVSVHLPLSLYRKVVFPWSICPTIPTFIVSNSLFIYFEAEEVLKTLWSALFIQKQSISQTQLKTFCKSRRTSYNRTKIINPHIVAFKQGRSGHIINKFNGYMLKPSSVFICLVYYLKCAHGRS